MRRALSTGRIKLLRKTWPTKYGSLAKRLLQLENKRFSEGFSKEQLKEKISDELADMLAEIVFIADKLDIDLDLAAKKMFGSDRRKIESRSTRQS